MNIKWKRYIPELLLAAALLGGLVCGAVQAQASRQDWRHKLIRLHVVANSDSEEDQTIKLEVRDAVLKTAETLLADAHDADDANTRLEASLPLLEEAANEVLCGSGQRAQVSLQEECFPLRYYETFSLPAGEYDALRVTIGAGEGHNWWCVVYPSLCRAATTEEVAELAISAGLTEAEAAQLTSPQNNPVYRLKVVEWYQRIKAWLNHLL